MDFSYAVPECKCDFRGKQFRDQGDNYCWLQETPCKGLDGEMNYKPRAKCIQGENVVECDTFLGKKLILS